MEKLVHKMQIQQWKSWGTCETNDIKWNYRTKNHTYSQ